MDQIKDIKVDIPVERVDLLKKYLNKIISKAIKFGITPIKYSVSNEVVKNSTSVSVAPGKVVKGVYQTQEVTVTGEIPHYEDWHFVAEVIPFGEGVLTRGYADVPERYRDQDTALVCEHCNMKRRRKHTFIIQKDDEWKKVGSKCLQDFIPTKSINSVVKYFEDLFNLFGYVSECADDTEWRGLRISNATAFDIQDYMELIVGAVDAYGWVSKAKARDSYGAVSTADYVWSQLTDCFGGHRHDRKDDIVPTDKQKQEATDTIEWVRTEIGNKEHRNDFEENLKVAYSEDFVVYETSGLVAAGINCYRRYTEYQRTQEDNKNDLVSDYVGQVKDKLEVDVTVLKVRSFEGAYGTIGMHKMIDSDGSVFVWWASPSTDWLEEGGEYKIKCTVKEHKMYNGEKQTTVIRVKGIEKVTV